MFLRLIVLLFFFCYIPLHAAAQVPCGNESFHQLLLQTDPVYKTNFESLQNQLQTIVRNRKLQGKAAQLYTIPVVVHIVHLGEPIGTGTNISDAQVQDAINGLNQRYRNVVGNGSIDAEFNFCLAVRAPNGCATNGINRVNGSAIPNYGTFGIQVPGCSPGANEESVKALSRWPVSDYYNIWVVSNICNGNWGGWSYYPNGSPNDGTVIRYLYMNSNSYLLAHEVGHGFNLYHTFEGDGNNSVCPVNTDCSANGDGCCDTPPHMQSTCGATNPCTASGIWDNSRLNYMSYCVPSIGRFTPDQKNRMQATMAISPRLSLASSLGCSPTGLSPTITASGPTTFCSANSNVTLTSSLANSYLWSNGATTQSITVAVSGNYTVTVSNGSGCTGISPPVTVVAMPDPTQPVPITGNTVVAPGQSADYLITIVNGATNYNWQLSGGGSINSGLNTPTVSINWNTVGNYTLSVTASNTCAQSPARTLNITVSPTTGINTPPDPYRITILPSLSAGVYNLSAKGLANKKVELEIVNVAGQKVYQFQTNVAGSDFNKRVDLTKIADGLYFITITIDKKKYLRKIVKQQ
jgi:PKD-like domain/Pregnancy-associated plasma protein-A/Secretion system C-terminal sorting domain